MRVTQRVVTLQTAILKAMLIFDRHARATPNEGYSCLTKLRRNGEEFFEFCHYFLPADGAGGYLVIFECQELAPQRMVYAVRRGEVFVSGHPEFQFIFSGLIDLDDLSFAWRPLIDG